MANRILHSVAGCFTITKTNGGFDPLNNGGQDDMITITKASILSGKENTISIDMTQEAFDESHNLWKSGMLIQKAFPNLDADEREFLMTGITADEWP